MSEIEKVEPREPRTWLVLVPEGDDVQFARSPMADGKLIISDSRTIKAQFEKAIHPLFFGKPVYKAEFGPITLLDQILYDAAKIKEPKDVKFTDVTDA
jgi:isopentenyl phosphate kinase